MGYADTQGPGTIPCILITRFMQFTGIIVKVGELQEIPSTKAESGVFYRRNVTICASDGRNERATFELKSSLAKEFNGQIGQNVTVSFDLRGVECETKNGLQEFNHLQAWRIDC